MERKVGKMNILDIIAKKRDKGKLTKEEDCAVPTAIKNHIV